MKGRLVDLSHTIRPGAESRLFETEMIKASQVAGTPWLPGQWYIMHNIRTVTHIGTHVECPYHINENGADAATVPLENLVGEAVVADLRGLAPRTEITLSMLQNALEKAGGVQPGDFVLLHTGWDQYYETPDYHDCPYLAPEAAQWMVDQGVKMIGIDTGGAEVPGSEQHVNHHIMLDNGVPHVENVCNMAALRKSRVMLFAAPVAIVGLESFPLRVVAIEQD